MKDKKPLIYWDFLGAHKPHSGLHTHMLSLKGALEGKEVFPELLGEGSSFYRFLLSLPLSKLTCPHYGSFLLKPARRAVFHSFANLNTSFLFGESSFLKKVITVHDLIPLLAKEKASRLSYFQFKFFLGMALESVDKVLCVSSWTKACLEKSYPQFSEKYEVVPNGISKKIEKKNLCKPRKKKGLHVLCVSRFEWYKRFELALDLVEADPSMKLFFVTNGKGKEFLESSAKERKVSQRVFVFEGLSEEALNKLYGQCDVFLHTSLYEGFCLPAYESLRFLKPVVFQKGHALDELGRDVSVGLEPSSCLKDWLLALQEAKRLSEGAFFEASVSRAFASFLSWDEVAEKVKEIYQKV